MEDFPEFMKNTKNKIKQSSQYTSDIEGYVFDGIDGLQLAFWTCHQNCKSDKHVHVYDEYLVCVHGQYTVIMEGDAVILTPGKVLFIAKGIMHSGESIAGTMTIHAFGGKRAEREY